MSKLRLLSSENIKKGFSYGYHYLKHRVKRIPLGVNYDLTWHCNLKCKHCYFNSSVEELSKNLATIRDELTNEEWLKVFKYHSDMGIRSASLTGGEPTLRMSLIYKAIKIFPSVQIASNGIIKLPWFQHHKQPIYWVSLDGGEEKHNEIRGAKIFQKVIENIKNDKRVLISTTITAMNYREIENVVSIVYKTGVSGIFFLMYTGYPNDPLLLKGEKLKYVVESILKVMKDYGDFILISKKMLEFYITKEFISHCIFKRGGIKSYYPNGQRKFCVMGNSALLCENCGCIVPVASYALSKLDSETIDKLKKFPF
ncbi:MAG: radical SAM protein [Promethearchaeota archaeon]|nr:MAG: radical SAM protein [Candidatus Lokiarchaeota archaeon]